MIKAEVLGEVRVICIVFVSDIDVDSEEAADLSCCTSSATVYAARPGKVLSCYENFFIRHVLILFSVGKIPVVILKLV